MPLPIPNFEIHPISQICASSRASLLPKASKSSNHLNPCNSASSRSDIANWSQMEPFLKSISCPLNKKCPLTSCLPRSCWPILQGSGIFLIAVGRRNHAARRKYKEFLIWVNRDNRYGLSFTGMGNPDFSCF